MKKLLLLLISLTFFYACGGGNIGTTKMRGDELQYKWLKEHFVENIVQKKATPDKSKNYLLKIAVLTAKKDSKGDPWNKEQRTENPDLKLYIVLPSGGKTEIGNKANSLTLFSEYPINLKGQDTITLRLVNNNSSYYETTYGSKYYNDSRRENNNESPLAQLDFVFEGQGKYLQFSGNALFIIEISELVSK